MMIVIGLAGPDWVVGRIIHEPILYLQYMKGGGIHHGFSINRTGGSIKKDCVETEDFMAFFQIQLRSRKMSWERIDSLIAECFRALHPLKPDQDYVWSFRGGQCLLRPCDELCTSPDFVHQEVRRVIKPLMAEYGFDRHFADR